MSRRSIMQSNCRIFNLAEQAKIYIRQSRATFTSKRVTIQFERNKIMYKHQTNVHFYIVVIFIYTFSIQTASPSLTLSFYNVVVRKWYVVFTDWPGRTICKLNQRFWSTKKWPASLFYFCFVRDAFILGHYRVPIQVSP